MTIKTNHRKPPQTTAKDHKSPPEFGTIGSENSGKQANHCKPPSEFAMMGICVLVKSNRRVNLRLNPKKIDTKGFLTDSGRICHVK